MKALIIWFASAMALLPSLAFSNDVEEILKPYKQYLDQGTFEGENSKIDPLTKSRYATFLYSFQNFNKINGKVVVELGTSRSFTHGGLPGCNSDDPSHWTSDQPQNWDWGAGFFTRMAAMCLYERRPEIHTVDLSKNHIERCKIMTADFADVMYYHVSDSVKYLENCNFPNGIDLLYLDTGDMTPIEPTAMLQLAEAKIIVKRNLLSEHGIILIDDVKNQTPKKFGETSDLGKSKYSIPYFLSNGYEIVLDEYQVVLRRKRQ